MDSKSSKLGFGFLFASVMWSWKNEVWSLSQIKDPIFKTFCFVSVTCVNSQFCGRFCYWKTNRHNFCRSRRRGEETVGCADRRRCCIIGLNSANGRESHSVVEPSLPSCFGKGALVNITRVSLADFQKLGVQVDRGWRFLLPIRKNEVLLSTVVGSLTFSLIGQPIVGVDSTVTWVVVGLCLGIWCLDYISFNNNLTKFCSGIFQNRQRVAVHEAGHFLTAYLLGVRIEGYSVDVWTALKQGRACSGVLFNEQDVFKLLKNNPSYIIVIWLAGIAAEILVFGTTEGGQDDIEQVKLLMKPGEIQDPNQYLRRVIYQAMECLHRHFGAFENLQKAMRSNESLEKCFRVIEENVV